MKNKTTKGALSGSFSTHKNAGSVKIDKSGQTAAQITKGGKK